MTKLETLKEVRLNGNDVPAGKTVELDDVLSKRWVELGLAKLYIEPKAKPVAQKEKPKPKPSEKK